MEVRPTVDLARSVLAHVVASPPYDGHDRAVQKAKDLIYLLEQGQNRRIIDIERARLRDWCMARYVDQEAYVLQDYDTSTCDFIGGPVTPLGESGLRDFWKAKVATGDKARWTRVVPTASKKRARQVACNKCGSGEHNQAACPQP